MLVYPYLILLLIISIETCPLKTVNIHTGCYCGIEIDSTNYIHCHPYTIDEIPEFTRSYVYDKLNLSKNFIEYLTDKSFNNLKIKNIYLEDNPIKSIDKQTFNNNLLNYLEELYIDTLNKNHTLEFLCYGNWKKLRILKLSGFDFNQYQFCFDKLYRLEKLIIQNSNIKILSHHIYKLPFLYELSLINNQIESLNFDEQFLSHSSSIRILNLTSNQLRTIPNDLNIRLPHLITLDISHNFIENLPFINQITTLNINLSFNLINYFQLDNNQHFLDLSFNPICTIENIEEKSNILLNNLNNLHCDCRLGFLLRNNFTNQLKLFGNQTTCATPKLFKGRLLKDLTYEQLMNTCSYDLPKNCKEVTNFKEIHDYTKQQNENITQIIETAERLNNDQNKISSFRLTSFYTHYENNDLLIFWDFDASASFNHLLSTKFQIIIEQESSSHTEIIRRSAFISPYLKQYIIPHLPSNKNYYVCLLLTRTTYGTDKYCRETRTTMNQTLFYQNRSIIFGFLVGIVLTTCLLIAIGFVCHLHYKQKTSSSPLFHPHHHQNYMYIDRNSDGTYSHSLISSPSPKYHHISKKTYLTPCSPWYQNNSKQLSSIQRSPCCFLNYHDRTLSSSITTNRIASLSSEYSNGIDKEQMTSTSIMSNISLDEKPNNINIIQTPAKHLYEELGDTNLFL